MSQDIDAALQGWEYKPEGVQARRIRAGDGREVIQIRMDLGVFQLETLGRPDGIRPHGCATYLDYLRRQARRAERAGESFVLTDEQADEADREFSQFYHRRVAWLALQGYAQALADADHTLRLMDFVRQHSPSDEYTLFHEQYRGFVLFHRTQAAAGLAVEAGKPEAAIDAIHDGLKALRAYFAEYEIEDAMEDNGMVQRLRKLERSLRRTHHIEATLQEQLDEAIAKEEYERAAQLRDALREKK